MEYFGRRALIRKGWSGDKKYRIRTENGYRLLRISPSDRHDRAVQVFRTMKRFFDLGIPMCEPIELGVCEEGVYSLQGWIDGEDAEQALRRMPSDRQYAYGLEAGEILRRMHVIPAPKSTEPWEIRFGRKIDRKLESYAACPIRIEGGESLVSYLEENRGLLLGRRQVLQHGDYHTGNMMLGRDGRLYVIDFDRCDVGDPWEEFNRIVWDAQLSPDFASGMLDGYFGGEIPNEFWALLALYIASNTLGSIPWAIPYGQREVGVMRRQAAQVLSWYEGMTRTVPSWYRPRT